MRIEEYWAKPGVTIGEHIKDLLSVAEKLQQYNYIDGKLYELLQKACIYHDYGKANGCFQKRVSSTEKLRFNPEKEVPHNVLSGFLLNPKAFTCEEEYYRVLYAVMYHHDYGNPYEIARKPENKLLIKSLLNKFTLFNLNPKILNLMQKMIYDDQAIKLKGFLHKCDYSASGKYVAEYPNDFLENMLENVKKKWRKYNPDSDWNDLQKYCISHRDRNIIVVAQTGMGKTEAGLQWIGNNKGYFVLPLRTAINAIYDRIRKDILLEEKLDTRLSVLHSESLEYYSRCIDQELDLLEYENRGKRFSIPLNISTMDQLFDFVLKYQGYELKLTTLSYSKIVIDEIQMYDPELLAYLIYGMKRITELGGRIAIMTATLSPFIRDLLIDEIPTINQDSISIFTNDMTRHNIKVEDKKLEVEDILKCYSENLEKKQSNKILVVCNTIKKAQEIYQEMEARIDNINDLHILHSRFVKKDRAALENEIIEFGKTFEKNNVLDEKNGVWISTSLVEASLDIDFDYLFTELQDINSLFQRMGRCNRKGVKNVDNPNCFVYLQIEEGLLKGTNAMIDSTIFILSKKAIQSLNGPLTEKEKLKVLNQTLTKENLKDSDYYRTYKATIEWIKDLQAYEFKKDDKKLRNILSMDVIPHQLYEENKELIQSKIEIIKEYKKNVIEQVKAKEEIMNFSLSIPYYKWLNYQKAIKTNCAESYPILSLGKFGEIPVMECNYSNLGFQEIDYHSMVRKVEFL